MIMQLRELSTRESISFGILLLLVISISLLGIFVSSNYFLYGVIAKIFPSHNSDKSALILVRETNQQSLSTLLELSKHNDLIIIPDGFDSQSLSKLKQMGLTLAIEPDEHWLKKNNAENLVCRLQPLIVASDVVGASINSIQPSDCPTYFSQNISLTEEFSDNFNLWKYSGNEEFLLDLSIDIQSIPQLDLASIPQGELSNLWLKQHHIIVTRDFESLDQGYHIPLVSQRVPLGMIHVLISDTLRSGNKVSLYSPLLLPFILVIIFIGTSICSLQKRLKVSLVLNALLFINYLMLVYFCANWLNKMLPFAEMLFGHLVLFSTILLNKQIRFEESYNNVSDDLHLLLQEHRVSKAFAQPKELWEAMHRMIHQYLFLERSIFLQVNRDSKHVSEISSYQCALADIKEPRRDYSRAPYNDAVANDIIEIKRDFFKQVDEDERQFMIALSFAGELVGFWVMTTNKDSHFDSQAFNRNVKAFASEVAELTFHYRQMQQQKKNQNYWLLKLLNLNNLKQSFKKLKGNVESLKKRLFTLENVLDGLTSPTVLFDLFGRTVHVNKAMDQLIADIDFKLYNNTALELLSHVTGLQRNEARGKLRFMILNHAKSEFLLRNLIPGNDYLLKLRPINANQSDRDDIPFETNGILFEFIDVTDVTTIALSKRDYYQRYFYEFKKNYEQSKIDLQLQKFIALGEQTLARGMDYSEQRVNPIRIIKQATVLSSNIATKNSLNITLDDSDLPPILVSMDAQLFKSIILEALAILIEDAIQGSDILITISEENTLNISLKNVGFGVSHNRLQDNISGASEFFEKQLKSWNHSLSRWDHQVDAEHKVGSGIEILFKLKLYAFALETELRLSH